MPFTNFHSSVEKWFDQNFTAPSPVQAQAWPAIKEGRHALLAAPTGSGKTLAAFLAVIDDLLQEGMTFGLPDETRVLYISPLKALSNDIEKNLQHPLMGIRDELMMQGLPDVDIRVAVRTGDTTNAEREKMRRKAPHILVTTPESLFILLTSKSGRKMLSTVRTVIVDEIHALAGDKRGSHLTLSLERLCDLSPYPINRIGISATQKPIERMANYLIGDRKEPCEIIDTGHVRERDLAIVVPDSPLEALMSNEVWEEVYDKLAALCNEHRTTLIFVNTRRLAERAAKHLADRLGEDMVTSHHGSLAKEHRMDAESRLKNGQLKALVATASLELGIDIGDIDLVCQLGSPGSIAVFLQRVGRSGHSLEETPKGRLFPLTRDDLVEAAAILDAIRRGELDKIRIPKAPLDILAQHIVAEVACEEWSENKLYRLFTRAMPYMSLEVATFERIVRMLSEGYSTRRGRRGAYIHRDQVNKRLRDRRGARLVAIMNGGAIPDLFDYDVVLSPQGFSVGTLNEDFAFESLPGDIFQLGNTSYRILKIETGKVHVEDAKGMPPNIPFWFGEAPGRSDELSFAVSRLREDLNIQLDGGKEKAQSWIERTITPGDKASSLQLSEYMHIAKVSMNALPTQKNIVLERFFDETGDMHLVVHSSFGSRVNRAWGLALRKRFCRKFNFELQAAALEDSIILSLGATHSFPLEEVARYLNSKSVRRILIQALLDAPMFETHWRWNATIALAIQRNRNGKRVPPQFQRNDAEDLVAQIFPDQLACLENIAGEREIPDHPLVNQTLQDCLTTVMDIDGLEQVLRDIESNKIEIICRDLTTPSVLAQEILNARPFAFLDPAPAEERRTLAVKSRRYIASADVRDLSRTDPDAVKKIRHEAWPIMRNAEELHDALLVHACLTESESSPTPHQWLAELMQSGRACRLIINDSTVLWVAAERLTLLLLIYPNAIMEPSLKPLNYDQQYTEQTASVELLRSRLQALGPITVPELANDLQLSDSQISGALLALEQEGFVMQGHFDSDDIQWCERSLVARINRYSLNSIRKQSTSVSPESYMKFLFDWHNTGEEKARGADAIPAALHLLSGYPMTADALLHAMQTRIEYFQAADLDALCSNGRYVWFQVAGKSNNKTASSLSKNPVLIIPREDIHFWRKAGFISEEQDCDLSSSAKAVYDYINQNGASFFVDIVQATGQLRTQVETALCELCANGLVHSDSLAGLRALSVPPSRRPSYSRFGKRAANLATIDDSGRWDTVKSSVVNVKTHKPAQLRLDYDTIEYFLSLYLNRYGVVFKKLLERETTILPWRDILPVLQRLEARGDLHGGRFVDGFSGIQFALPEAANTLRKYHKSDQGSQDVISISAADPLNMTGILLPNKRLSSHANNKLVFRAGQLLATKKGDELEFIEDVDEETRWTIQMQQKNSVKISGKRFRVQ